MADDPDFGTTIRFVNGDIDPLFGLISGRAALTQAIRHRLETPRGKLRGRPSYGYDIRTKIGAGIADKAIFQIQQEITSECQKDERVARAVVRASFDATTGVLSARIGLVTSLGEFRLLLTADQLQTSLIDEDATPLAA
jgi:phage baseplate assembly protein W